MIQRGDLQNGVAEIWTARATTALVGARITAVQAFTGYDQSLTVIAFRGADGTGAGAIAGGLNSAPGVSLTTTRAGSLVYGVGSDWKGAVGRGLGANQTMVHQWVDTSANDTFWCRRVRLRWPRRVRPSRSTMCRRRRRLNGIARRSKFLRRRRGPPQQVAVPNVVGLTQAAATTAITGANLTLGTVTTASSTTVPAGSVISQTPTAGTQATQGSAVNLVVSSGPPQVAVPNVVGLTQAAATSAITGANLTLGTVTTASSTTVPAGSVISQTPTAGTQATQGSAVNLVVSSGPPQVAVPNVVGLTQTAATSAITGANLTLGTVTTASSTTVPAGSVISQTPTAGTQATQGSAVNLVVSSGPPQVAVPNVVGLDAGGGDVRDHRREPHARDGDDGVEHDGAGRIGDQSNADRRARRSTQGSAVNLVVSSGPPQVAVPNVVGLTQTAATSAITGANLTLGTVTTASSTTVPAGSVISQTPTAGTQATQGSAVNLVVSSGSAAGRGAERRRLDAGGGDVRASPARTSRSGR